MHQHSDIYGQHSPAASPEQWGATDPSLALFALVSELTEYGIADELKGSKGDDNSQRVLIGLLKKLRKNIKAASFEAMKTRSRALHADARGLLGRLDEPGVAKKLTEDCAALVACSSMFSATRGPLFGNHGLTTISKTEMREVVLAAFLSTVFNLANPTSRELVEEAFKAVCEEDCDSHTQFLKALVSMKFAATSNAKLSESANALSEVSMNALGLAIGSFKKRHEEHLIRALYEEGCADPVAIFNPLCSLGEDVWSPLYCGRIGSPAARQILGLSSGFMTCMAEEREDGSVGDADAKTVARIRRAENAYPMSALVSHLVSTRAETPIIYATSLFSTSALVSRIGLASLTPADGDEGFVIEESPKALEDHRPDLNSVDLSLIEDRDESDRAKKIVVPSHGMAGMAHAMMYLGMAHGNLFEHGRVLGSAAIKEIGNTTTSSGNSRIIDDALRIRDLVQTEIIEHLPSL